MRYPEFPVFGFLAAALVLIPLPRLVRASNIAGIALVFWIFQDCLVIAINTLIWSGNVRNSAPAWCELASKFKDGVPIAVAASTFCISRHLEFIASGRPITADFLQRHRRVFESFMCFGVPGIWMFIFYFFQKNKYLIIEDFGCCNEYYPSIIPFLVLYAPPLQLSGATVIYGCVSLHHIISNRPFQKLLSPYLMSRDPALSTSQILRLIALSMILGIPGTIWIVGMYQELAFVGFGPLPNWHTIHAHSNTVATLLARKISPDHRRSLTIRWWAILAEAYILFLCFGTSREVLLEYRKMWVWFKISVLKQPIPETHEPEKVKPDPNDSVSLSGDPESNLKVSGIPFSTRILQSLKLTR